MIPEFKTPRKPSLVFNFLYCSVYPASFSGIFISVCHPELIWFEKYGQSLTSIHVQRGSRGTIKIRPWLVYSRVASIFIPQKVLMLMFPPLMCESLWRLKKQQHISTNPLILLYQQMELNPPFLGYELTLVTCFWHTECGGRDIACLLRLSHRGWDSLHQALSLKVLILIHKLPTCEKAPATRGRICTPLWQALTEISISKYQPADMTKNKPNRDKL